MSVQVSALCTCAVVEALGGKEQGIFFRRQDVIFLKILKENFPEKKEEF